MESLEETQWDVTISGTGVAQSLLALYVLFDPPRCTLLIVINRALSRSGKKVLHVDKNPYYGGSEAALSLDEAEGWAQGVNKGGNISLPVNRILTDLCCIS